MKLKDHKLKDQLKDHKSEDFSQVLDCAKPDGIPWQEFPSVWLTFLPHVFFKHFYKRCTNSSVHIYMPISESGGEKILTIIIFNFSVNSDYVI